MHIDWQLAGELQSCRVLGGDDLCSVFQLTTPTHILTVAIPRDHDRLRLGTMVRFDPALTFAQVVVGLDAVTVAIRRHLPRQGLSGLAWELLARLKMILAQTMGEGGNLGAARRMQEEAEEMRARRLVGIANRTGKA